MSSNPPLKVTGETEIDWEEIRRSLYFYFNRKLYDQSSSQIDDLVQEAAVRLLRVIRREGIQNLDALLNTIAHRTRIDYLRRLSRWRLLHQQMDGAALERASPGVEAPKAFGDPQERLEFIVRQFFRNNKSTCEELAAAFFAERDWHVVSEELNISHATIRKRWSRCLEALRKWISKESDHLLLGRCSR